ncbi:MAG: DUF6443 domain-containing protein, partial [Prevotellaceae bacterium]|nr:DUF6443 domain-containing protein [Prevotellaceae bacterium]
MKTRIFLILTICCLFFDITESAGQADTTQYNITLPYISFKQSNTYTMDALGTGINTSANIVPFFSSQQSMSNTDADGIRTLLNEYLDNNGWGDILRIAMIKYVASSDDNTSNILNIRITMFILRNENNYNRRIVITGIGSDTITVNQSSIMPDTYPSMSGNCMLMRTYTRPGGTYYFEDIAYFDALGYPEQNISVQASPNRRNIVTPIVFDNMKRNAHNFLPYVSTSATFSNDADPLNRQKTYYANMYDTIEANYTFVKKEYEPSILNRVVKEYNVGSVFQGANDKYRLYDYGVNAENEAFILNVNSETFALTVSGYYQSGELYKNTSVNEDGITTVTFTDKNDNAVLQRIIDSAQTNDTYYAYDDSGHQCWAISPEGSVRLVSGVTYPANNQLAKLYCYVYKYDGRGNITERRIPGREPEYMVYDRGGRLVMSQDGNMRQNSQWIYNVYDNHNNIVERNMTQGDKTREELQSMFLDESFNNDYVSVGNSGRIFSPFLFNASSTNYSLERTRYYGGLYFDTYLATSNVKYLKGNDSNMSKCRPSPLLGVPCQVCDEFNVLMDGTNHIKSEYFYGTNADSALIKYYRLPNQAAVSVAQCLISMYPNYFHEILDEAPFVYQGVPWVNPQTLAFAPVDSVCTLDDLETEKIKGLKAYEKVRVLDESNTYVERAFYYDYWGRMIQTVEKNHLGGISRYSVKYDFAGNILAALEQHETEGTISTAIAIKVNTAVVNTKKLTEFAYDHRGRLKSTATTLNDDATAAVSYRYSELGRLEKTVYGDNVVIQTSARNMQGWITEQQATAYKNSHQPITSGGINLFKSALKYYDTRRAVPNYAGNITEWTWQHQNDTTDTYTFAYDRLNRLVDNRHYRGAGAAPVDMFTEQGMSYDRNGNISKIRRYDADGVCEDCDINYHYEGNQLKYCNTEIPMILMPLYAYDDNGNMNRDFKREMDITYNLLDLPYRIIKNDTVKATYKYLADGTKLSIAADTLVESNSGSSRVAAYKTVSYGFDYLGTCVYTRMGDTLNFESTAFAGGRIAKTTGGYDVNYFITDHLGSTRATVNDNGDITAQYNYYPFGKIWESAGTQAPTTRYLFSGKE